MSTTNVFSINKTRHGIRKYYKIHELNKIYLIKREIESKGIIS